MAGLTRSGEIYDTDIPVETLQLAIQNTVELIKSNTEIIEEGKDILDQKIN